VYWKTVVTVKLMQIDYSFVATALRCAVTLTCVLRSVAYTYRELFY